MSATLISRKTPLDQINRVVFIVIGCIAAWWGIVAFSIFWQQAPMELIADRVIAGLPYSGAVLARQLPTIDSVESAVYCRASALRSAAIIRLRMVEVAKSINGHKSADQDMGSLRNVIRKSLSCSPADPFLWLVLYWVESSQNRFEPEYLKMSYDLGPNEGWVAVKRNPVALADYERLPPDLATQAINEFLALINNGFYEQAADILSGPAWRLRDTLLPRLASLPLRNREKFAQIVYDKNLSVVIPGVEMPDSQPRWR